MDGFGGRFQVPALLVCLLGGQDKPPLINHHCARFVGGNFLSRNPPEQGFPAGRCTCGLSFSSSVSRPNSSSNPASPTVGISDVAGFLCRSPPPISQSPNRGWCFSTDRFGISAVFLKSQSNTARLIASREDLSTIMPVP